MKGGDFMKVVREEIKEKRNGRKEEVLLKEKREENKEIKKG